MVSEMRQSVSGTSGFDLLAKAVSTQVTLFMPCSDYFSVTLADSHRLA